MDVEVHDVKLRRIAKGKNQFETIKDVSCLGCFGVVQRKDLDPQNKCMEVDGFFITHLPSGVSFTHFVFDTIDETLAAIREISTIADWTSPDPNTFETDECKEKIKAMFEVVIKAKWSVVRGVSAVGCDFSNVNPIASRACYEQTEPKEKSDG